LKAGNSKAIQNIWIKTFSLMINNSDWKYY
jgi:hypothetical protein